MNKSNSINEADFVNGLQISTIGEMVNQKPDAQTQLIGNDWFNLSNKYGKWLFASRLTEKSDLFLSAMTENRPKDANEQFNLGFFFLEQKEFSRALEHFRLAAELKPNDKSFLPFIGAAYFQLDERQNAFETWAKIINDEDITIKKCNALSQNISRFRTIRKSAK